VHFTRRAKLFLSEKRRRDPLSNFLAHYYPAPAERYANCILPTLAQECACVALA